MPLLKNIFKVMFLSFNSLKLQLMEKKETIPKKGKKKQISNQHLHSCRMRTHPYIFQIFVVFPVYHVMGCLL